MTNPMTDLLTNRVKDYGKETVNLSLSFKENEKERGGSDNVWTICLRGWCDHDEPGTVFHEVVEGFRKACTARS